MFPLNPNLDRLTKAWGTRDSVSLYLRRCQVETPDNIVQATWRHVSERRTHVGKAVDFGAGDGRFSNYGDYVEYIGYEIDSKLCSDAHLPPKAALLNRCAFLDQIDDADLCIGNPPFVRNQDLPTGWRRHASAVVHRRTGVTISGLANAWQYFFFLALASVHDAGICALIIPYEWVSRPSAKAIRDFILDRGWTVRVYRLVDATFNSVLTTSSITVVDKARKDTPWTYFEETATGIYSALPSPSGGRSGVIPYLPRHAMPSESPRAKRGLSPGTQKVLTLTEGERVRHGLRVDRDVVPCVTTLRHLPDDVRDLDDAIFRQHYRMAGRKCWLIRTDVDQSEGLAAYLRAVPESDYQTSTCREREQWWKFVMPGVPDALLSMSFNGPFPKAVHNLASVRAVGGVYGIYQLSAPQAQKVTSGFGGLDISDRIVSHSHGLHKIEVSQLNTLLVEVFGKDSDAGGISQHE